MWGRVPDPIPVPWWAKLEGDVAKVAARITVHSSCTCAGLCLSP